MAIRSNLHLLPKRDAMGHGSVTGRWCALSMADTEQAFIEVSDLVHEVKTHYQLAIWHAARSLPIESADEQALADRAAERIFEITDARGL